MQAYVIRNAKGQGGSNEDWVGVSNIYGTLTYNTSGSSSVLSQEAYRFYQNANASAPGTPLAAANTAASITAATPFRLRLLLDVATADLTAGASNFVLQAGEKVSTCSAATYAAATNFFDNSNIADNSAITTTADDPPASGGGAVEVAQTYNENNAFTSTNLTPTGDSALWDFSLNSVSGDAGKTYCFRVVYSNSTALSSYLVYPEIAFTSSGGGGPTAMMIPNGDVTDQWINQTGSVGDTSCAGGSACDYVDEGSTPDANQVHTGTLKDSTGEILEFTLTSPSDVDTATQVVVSAHLSSDTIAGTGDTVTINLRVNGTLMTASTTPALTLGRTLYTATFTGSWTQSDVDSMQIYLVRNAVGSGPASGRDDDVALHSTYATLSYTAGTPVVNPTLAQQLRGGKSVLNGTKYKLSW